MDKKKVEYQERLLNPQSGGVMMTLAIVLLLACIGGIIYSGVSLEKEVTTLAIIELVACIIILTFVFPMMLMGLKVVNPNEALVLVLFGKYYGTIVKDGFFFVNPFCVAVNPTVKTVIGAGANSISYGGNKKISLKAMTLTNEKQKVNDSEGNPIEIGVNVIWKVVNPTKAVLNIDNYKTYISTQCDAAIRQVAREYPYDIGEGGDEKSLRGSAQEVADELTTELQKRADIAGIEILEARIAHLAYAPEIAAAMLQRQQAAAVIAAKQRIVEGAVGMVEMALNMLHENKVVSLDDERKAQMVSNLLVVLCANKEASPIINSGSIY